MKKSLIALAVLTASGASFAAAHGGAMSGVSITGNLTYGYQGSTTGGVAAASDVDAAGFGAENARVVFTAKEDLGGGYTATATMGLNTGSAAGNAQGATADNTTLTLATPVGGLTLGTVKAAEYLNSGPAGLDAYYAGWDAKVLLDRSTRDFVAYTIPVGALTLSIGQQDKANTLGLGAGTTGADAASGPGAGTGSPLTFLSATYSAGPLVANGMYLAYKNSAAAGNAKDTTRLSASYDLGVAKLGAGFVMTNGTGVGTNPNPKITDFLIAAKVPMGASSFGLTYVSRQYTDAAATSNALTVLGGGANPGHVDGTATGFSLEYGYAMSKRTSVIANYARWTKANNALLASQNASTQYQLLLSHSF